MSAENSVAEAVADARAYLTLRALDRVFALPIEFVRSVFRIEAITRVPHAPSNLVGVSHWRDRILAIFCLARTLDPDARPLGVGASAVAINVGAETFALAVPEIQNIVFARVEDSLPSAGYFDRRQSKVTAGVIRSGAALVSVLEAFRIFDLGRSASAAQFNPTRPR